MFKFNFSKPKKVFEKLNKMDRKQAYTIGAIVVVLLVALMFLVSAIGSQEDDSFDGMKARGYDLAQMPFVNDEAEQYLLAAKYPDMRENASTLLYSAEEKEARQEADEESATDGENAADNEDGFSADGGNDANGYGPGAGRGYGGRGAGGGTKTEIGTLGQASMGAASGSGLNSYYGPSGDFRQFGKKEGYVAPAQLKTDNARNALGQFRSGSYAANRLKDNKMINARRAAQGASFQGSNAFGKEGIDVEKLGGLGLDTDAPPTTSDLGNLDKKVADAAKKAEPKDPPKEDIPWWQQMLQDLAKQAASALVGSIMDGIGDSIKGTISGKQAQYAARKQANTELYNNVQASSDYASFNKANPGVLTEDQYNGYKQAKSAKDTYKYSFSYKGSDGKTHTVDGGKRVGPNNQAGDDALAKAQADAQGSTDSSRYKTEDKGTPTPGCLSNCRGKTDKKEYDECVANCGLK